MRSFGFDTREEYGNRFGEIWSEIEKNRLYFKKFCGDRADEAMQKALHHAVYHYNAEKGGLKVYLKSLAKTINSTPNKRTVCVDFLENTVTDSYTGDSIGETNTYGAYRASDFSEEIIEDLYLDSDKTDEIADLALVSMNMFLHLCESLKTGSMASIYCPDSFIRSCMILARKCRSFNEDCLRIYEEYGNDMKLFIRSTNVNPDDKWVEADFTYINKRISKRVRLTDEEGVSVKDADIEPFYIRGNYKGKKVVKVRYKDIYEELLDMLDSPVSNAIKFCIGDRFIVKTLGGSLSVANPKLYNMYDLVEKEILTNLLKDTDNSQLLNIGSECMYFLCNDTYNLEIPEREIRGISLNFVAEEVLV